MRKLTVAALISVMAMSLLTGCGKDEALDGTKAAATINGTEIPMGMVSLAARQQQAQITAMYMSYMGSADNIWDTVYDEESGLTYGEEMKEDVVNMLASYYLMKEKAPEYGVEITEEDQSAIAEAAAAFMEDNTEETLTELAVTEDQVKELLELETIASRMHDAIVAEAEVEITDEEVQQSSFTYVSVYAGGEEITEDEIAETKAQAQEVLDQMLETPEADMNEIAAAVDEGLSAYDGNFKTTIAEDEEESGIYPQEVIDVLRTLEEGEVAPELVETENNFYIVRLDQKVDEEATEEERASVEQTKKEDAYTELTEGWLEEADLKLDEKVMATLQITDAHSFTMAAEEASEDELTEEVIEEDFTEEEILEDEIEEGEIIEEELLEEELPEEDLVIEEVPEEEASEEEVTEE